MLNRLIKEAEHKRTMLPASYFAEYFEKEFVPKLKEIHQQIQEICNEQADSLPVTLLQDRIKRVLF